MNTFENNKMLKRNRKKWKEYERMEWKGRERTESRRGRGSIAPGTKRKARPSGGATGKRIWERQGMEKDGKGMIRVEM